MIPDDLRDVILARRRAERHSVARPRLSDLERGGPSLSPQAFANIIGMSRSWVRQLCVDGTIKADKRGNRWRIDRAYALRWVSDFLKPAA
jgi:hypothetical protein